MQRIGQFRVAFVADDLGVSLIGRKGRVKSGRTVIGIVLVYLRSGHAAGGHVRIVVDVVGKARHLLDRGDKCVYEAGIRTRRGIGVDYVLDADRRGGIQKYCIGQARVIGGH
jgi:hypothetical protein